MSVCPIWSSDDNDDGDDDHLILRNLRFVKLKKWPILRKCFLLDWFDHIFVIIPPAFYSSESLGILSSEKLRKDILLRFLLDFSCRWYLFKSRRSKYTIAALWINTSCEHILQKIYFSSTNLENKTHVFAVEILWKIGKMWPHFSKNIYFLQKSWKSELFLSSRYCRKLEKVPSAERRVEQCQ